MARLVKDTTPKKSLTTKKLREAALTMKWPVAVEKVKKTVLNTSKATVYPFALWNDSTKLS